MPKCDVCGKEYPDDKFHYHPARYAPNEKGIYKVVEGTQDPVGVEYKAPWNYK